MWSEGSRKQKFQGVKNPRSESSKSPIGTFTPRSALAWERKGRELFNPQS